MAPTTVKSVDALIQRARQTRPQVWDVRIGDTVHLTVPLEGIDTTTDLIVVEIGFYRYGVVTPVGAEVDVPSTHVEIVRRATHDEQVFLLNGSGEEAAEGRPDMAARKGTRGRKAPSRVASKAKRSTPKSDQLAKARKARAAKSSTRKAATSKARETRQQNTSEATRYEAVIDPADNRAMDPNIGVPKNWSRNHDIAVAVAGGATVKDLAAKYGLSEQRAGKLVKQMKGLIDLKAKKIA